MTKQTHNHCPRPDVGHVLYATRWSQCCDIFGRQTGRAIEGCESLNAVKTVLGQYAPVPLTRVVNLKQGGSLSSSFGQDCKRVFTRACLKQ